MRTKISTISRFFAIFLFIISGNFAVAQEKGRMADGRAFRTDSAGNQLVDYIAELEVSTEALNRRVMGLEDEITAKNRMIEQLRSGGGANIKPLAESDLLRSNGDSANGDSANGDSAKNVATRCSVSDCATVVKSQIEPLQQELQRTRVSLEEERQQAQSSFEDYESNIKELRVKVQNPNCPRMDCGAEISRVADESRRNLESARAENVRLTREMNSQIEELKAELSSSQGELLKVRSQYVSAVERADRATAVAKRAEQIAAPEVVAVNSLASTDARASYRAPSTKDAVERATTALEVMPPMNPGMPASLVAARERAVMGLRSGLMQDLSEVTTLIAKRDRQFARFKQPTGAVKIKSSSAVAASGRDLNTIAKDARNAKSVYELSQLRKDLADIRAKTQDDIAIMTRMSSR